MNIKTAVHLAIGVGIGFFIFGKDEDQEKVVRFVKNKLKWLLYADDSKSSKETYQNRPITYSQLTRKERNTRPTDPYWKTLLQFESKEEAEQFLECITRRLDNYGYITIKELAVIRNKACDYFLENYGWIKSKLRDEDLQVLYIQDGPYFKCYIISLSHPRYLEPADISKAVEDASNTEEGDSDAE